MAFGVGNKIPANSILRQGTLLLGVPRQEQQSETDPMQPAIDQIERALRAKDAEVMNSEFLFRGVSEAFHRANDGLLKPKVQGQFAYAFHWDEPGANWDSGITWDSTSTNAVIRHQLNQEAFPTSGISTTPHLARALFYVRGPKGTAGGYVFKISRRALSLEGVEQFVVAKFCAPSVPEDDEVILVIRNREYLQTTVVTEIIEVPSLIEGLP